MGDVLLVDGGIQSLRVEAITDTDVLCTVVDRRHAGVQVGRCAAGGGAWRAKGCAAQRPLRQGTVGHSGAAGLPAICRRAPAAASGAPLPRHSPPHRRRHLNIRGKSANLPAITDRDWADIRFGVEVRGCHLKGA